MRHLLKLRQHCSAIKNVSNTSDIIRNYQHLTDCQRKKNIIKEAYLSATDYHEQHLLTQKNSGEHYSRLTDMISFSAAKTMYQRMESNSTGRRILTDKPRITDEVYNNLATLKQGTFGYFSDICSKQYYNFMNGLNFKPSQRPIVRYIPDLEYAYILQRYKQIHDFLHVLLAKHISVHEQLVIKWFQMRQLRLPSATLASLISPFLSKQFNLSEIANIIRIADRAQFVMNIYFQEHFTQDANLVRKKFRFQ